MSRKYSGQRHVLGRSTGTACQNRKHGLGYDLCSKGCDIDGALNHRLDSRHMLLPSRAETAELLVQHLAAVCRRP